MAEGRNVTAKGCNDMFAFLSVNFFIQLNQGCSVMLVMQYRKVTYARFWK